MKEKCKQAFHNIHLYHHALQVARCTYRARIYAAQTGDMFKTDIASHTELSVSLWRSNLRFRLNIRNSECVSNLRRIGRQVNASLVPHLCESTNATQPSWGFRTPFRKRRYNYLF
eukprot:621522-Prorocentrum_minimum.AAC.5